MTLTKKIFKQIPVAAVTAFAVMFGGASLAADNVGFVYVSPIGDAGWTYQHDLGRFLFPAAAGRDRAGKSSRRRRSG